MAREQYEHTWKDHYRLLQVHTEAEPEVIAAAYRRLAQLYHPDLNGDPDATSKFASINEAYEVLSDPGRRPRYDSVYKELQTERVGYTTSPRDSREPPDDAGYDHVPDWDAEPEYAYSVGVDGYEPPRQRNVALGLLSAFISMLAPNPDETQKILPWPRWSWQRSILILSIPLWALMTLGAGAQGNWPLMGLALFLSGLSLYSGLFTGWMRRTVTSNRTAKVTGGASIVLGGVTYSLIIVVTVLWLIMMAVIAAIGAALLRSFLSGGSRRF